MCVRVCVRERGSVVPSLSVATNETSPIEMPPNDSPIPTYPITEFVSIKAPKGETAEGPRLHL